MNRDHSERVKLEAGLDRLGLDIAAEHLGQLLSFMDLLKEWSGTYNLVAPGDRNFLLARHLLDSLSIANSLQEGSLLDIGTGAGLPGLPLAIIRPDRAVTLVDGTGKKIRFIRHVGRTLGLKNIRAIHARVEELKDLQPFSNISSRAFASLKQFVTLARPLADSASRLLAMKGAYPEAELEALPPWINIDSVQPLAVPYLHAERHLVLMSLNTGTPQK
jgi:16S rRNA (guanine527-N7)-methyltransferase